MGTVVGGIAMAKLGVGTAFGLDTRGVTGRAIEQGAWIENGLIDAGSSHESYVFLVRRRRSLQPRFGSMRRVQMTCR